MSGASTSAEAPASAPGGGPDERRTCWVCFACDEDEPGALWLSPCACKGSGRWVHEGCLERWIDEKQKGDSGAKVACAQCKTPYLIVYPRQGPLSYALEAVDRGIGRVCPLLTGGLIVGAAYWTATTYGAVVVFQVLGPDEGLRRMEACDSIVLLLALPTIPVLLIVGKMIRWEAAVLRLFHYYRPPKAPRAVAAEEGGIRDVGGATRVLCGALALPTVAVVLGRLCFPAHGPLKRVALGGLAFVLIRGLSKIYYDHNHIIRRSKRKIFNFEQREQIPDDDSTVASSSDDDDDYEDFNEDDDTPDED